MKKVCFGINEILLRSIATYSDILRISPLSPLKITVRRGRA